MNGDELRKRIDEMNKDQVEKMLDMAIEMAIAMGDPRGILMKNVNRTYDMLNGLTIDYEVSDEKILQIANLIEQFEKMVKDILKEG